MAAKKATQSPRERRVTKVLDAAQELFATRGYEATLVAEIAESASVAPATIYNYFSTKPNLLMELALRHVRAALPERRAFLKNLPENPLRRHRGLRAPARGTGAPALVARVLANNDGGANCRTAGSRRQNGRATERSDQTTICSDHSNLPGSRSNSLLTSTRARCPTLSSGWPR